MKSRIYRVAGWTLLLLFTVSAAIAGSPKYIFFFLGDGMSSAQIQAAEAYLATKDAVERGFPVGPEPGTISAAYLLSSRNRLNMCQLPIFGMQTTFDAFALQTDSASAATAFACGLKTRSGVIGMDDTKTRRFKSVAQLAHEQGRKVGIVTSVSLDHGTPAAYYAGVENRDYMNRIGAQMAESGFAFFGGGGLVSPTGPKREGDTADNIWTRLSEKGYEVRTTYDSILALFREPRNKVICIHPDVLTDAAMPYVIDSPSGRLPLAQITQLAINTLSSGRGGGRSVGQQKEAGFFIMVEGGKIDWACHANDAVTAISEIIDFDKAVGVALAFQGKHPKETLIVVTGDHETGGMTIGHSTTGYKTYFNRLMEQRCSFAHFDATDWARHKAAFGSGYDPAPPDNLERNPEMIALMKAAFGLDYAALNVYQKRLLEDAYDRSMSGTNRNSPDENTLRYGPFNPITVAITHILGEQAGIGWTSYSHTGVPVPVFAGGRGAEQFSGFYDNTDIARKLAGVMGVRRQLPVLKFSP